MSDESFHHNNNENKNKSKKYKNNNKLKTYESSKCNILFNKENESNNKKEEKYNENHINIKEDAEEEERKINNKNDIHILKDEENENKLESQEQHSDKETNNTDKHLNNSENQEYEIKKHKKLLGKKRHLIYYKKHSLSYNELYKLYDKKELEININTLFTYTNLNPEKIKGNFIGVLDNTKDKDNPDFIIETRNQDDNHNYSHFVIYNSKKFQKKLSFLENSSGNFYLLYNGYAAFFYNSSIKIYFFSKNNTQFDIFQKIMLPDELSNAILFPFKFKHNNNFYFFHKTFGLKKTKNILLYKFNKSEQKHKKDFAIRGKPFIEDKTLNLDFEFIWFVQKNNNELLFFYELDYKFNIYCFDLSTMEITQRKSFSLNKIHYVKIAQYADDVINKRFLVLSFHNILYMIDTHMWQIYVVKEHDVIEYFRVFSDNTLWTVESCEKTVNVDKNKKKIVNLMYVRQYKINENYQEIIKIGERKLTKSYSLINKLVQLGNKKVILFVEGKKLIMLN